MPCLLQALQHRETEVYACIEQEARSSPFSWSPVSQVHRALGSKPYPSLGLRWHQQALPVGISAWLLSASPFWWKMPAPGLSSYAV